VKIDLIIGTRPEAIKLAPVYRVLKHYPNLTPRTLVTGQHDELMRGIAEAFDLPLEQHLNTLEKGQSLAQLSARLLTALSEHFNADRPDLVIVQGDTSSAFFGALAAYYAKIPVAHVEAGLRTGNRYAPFPEEFNRRGIAQIAELHFAPTQEAFRRLRAEQIEGIHLTGNTIVDAVQYMRTKSKGSHPAFSRGEEIPEKKRILVTAHRRESAEGGLQAICDALKTMVTRHDDVEIRFPMHLNPQVRETIQSALGGVDRVQLLEPLSYPEMIGEMEQAWLLMTDSGGLQEEAPEFNLPTLVLRDETERREAIEAGTALLVGTDEERILNAFEDLYTHADRYAEMTEAVNPFGDGQAAVRIAEIIAHTFLPAPGTT
jgi:UDP-N-acetylglucosamine 2-epimerase (non-hydrolysing)